MNDKLWICPSCGVVSFAENDKKCPNCKRRVYLITNSLECSVCGKDIKQGVMIGDVHLHCLPPEVIRLGSEGILMYLEGVNAKDTTVKDDTKEK